VARRGAHRNGRGGSRVTVIVVILIVAVVGVGGWFLFLREGAPIDLGGPDPAEDFSFQLVRVKGESIEGNVEPEELEDDAEAVRETLDALYVAGYIDPAKWEGGTFPEALEQFSPSVRKQARREIDQFTLGADFARVENVRPVNARLDVSFLTDAEGTPVGAVAETVFAANARSTQGGHVSMQHDGTYYLLSQEDRWLISGWDVKGIVTPVEKPLPSPKGTP
jgi:hypothetical protein